MIFCVNRLYIMTDDCLEQKLTLFFETSEGNIYNDQLTQKREELSSAIKQLTLLYERIDRSETNKRQPRLIELYEEYENVKLQYETLLKEKDDIIAEILKLI